jgi:hypothetical protein
MMSALSPLRAKLASYENAYAVAVQRRIASGQQQYVIRTGDAVQAYRVSSRPPSAGDELLAMVA